MMESKYIYLKNVNNINKMSRINDARKVNRILVIAGFCLFALGGCTHSEKKISGSIQISPQLQKALQPTAVLYLIARSASDASGPPVAVKRYTQPFAFPIQFELSGKDAMIPDTPFEGNFILTARISQTGSATPVQKNDIEGVAQPNPSAVGTGNIKIVLDHFHEEQSSKVK